MEASKLLIMDMVWRMNGGYSTHSAPQNTAIAFLAAANSQHGAVQ